MYLYLNVEQFKFSFSFVLFIAFTSCLNFQKLKRQYFKEYSFDVKNSVISPTYLHFIKISLNAYV